MSGTYNKSDGKGQTDKHILGYAILSFGFGELWILITRV